MSSLKKRADFLRLQKEGFKWITPSFIVQMAPSSQIEPRVGYIVTRKIGKAVVRNRARRRLKEVVRLTLTNHACHGQDYVLIGRTKSLTQNFEELQKDLRWALQHVQRLYQESNLYLLQKK